MRKYNFGVDMRALTMNALPIGMLYNPERGVPEYNPLYQQQVEQNRIQTIKFLRDEEKKRNDRTKIFDKRVKLIEKEIKKTEKMLKDNRNKFNSIKQKYERKLRLLQRNPDLIDDSTYGQELITLDNEYDNIKIKEANEEKKLNKLKALKHLFALYRKKRN